MKNIQKYIDDNRLAIRKYNEDDSYSIVCYTKDQFFNHEWDDITITHRGKIYKDEKPINHPFKKIFNLNEHESTKFEYVKLLIQIEEFEVLDKVNGHLTIVSFDQDASKALVSTKGSFHGELADSDRQLLIEKGVIDKIEKYDLNFTFMFECLADYDKHLWFEEARKQYNVSENTFILLGAICNDTGASMDHTTVSMLAELFEVPVVRRFKELETEYLDIDELFKHKMTEGYVLHFKDINHRVKIKTQEYVTLHYMKEINSERLVNALYNSGHENMYREFDEEIYPVLDAVMVDLEQFFYTHCCDAKKLIDNRVSEWDKKTIATSTLLNDFERSIAFGKTHIKLSKTVRRMFKEHGEFPKTDEAIRNFFDKKLYSNVVLV